MRRWEYDVTIEKTDNFRTLAYFCSADGECVAKTVPGKEPRALVDLLNQRGAEGWELVQLSASGQELMGVWKRELT